MIGRDDRDFQSKANPADAICLAKKPRRLDIVWVSQIQASFYSSDLVKLQV